MTEFAREQFEELHAQFDRYLRGVEDIDVSDMAKEECEAMVALCAEHLGVRGRGGQVSRVSQTRKDLRHMVHLGSIQTLLVEDSTPAVADQVQQEEPDDTKPLKPKRRGLHNVYGLPDLFSDDRQHPLYKPPRPVENRDKKPLLSLHTIGRLITMFRNGFRSFNTIHGMSGFESEDEKRRERIAELNRRLMIRISEITV